MAVPYERETREATDSEYSDPYLAGDHKEGHSEAVEGSEGIIQTEETEIVNSITTLLCDRL
jgi:hypothetical protein